MPRPDSSPVAPSAADANSSPAAAELDPTDQPLRLWISTALTPAARVAVWCSHSSRDHLRTSEFHLDANSSLVVAFTTSAPARGTELRPNRSPTCATETIWNFPLIRDTTARCTAAG